VMASNTCCILLVSICSWVEKVSLVMGPATHKVKKGERGVGVG
jgi:hypothetical protein